MVPQHLHYLSVPSTGRHFAARLIAASASLLLATGCRNSDDGRVPVFPVHGQVKFKGLVPNGAFVVLHPKGGATTPAPLPRATVGPDGTFALSTYDGQDGAPEGEYVLTVQWHRHVKQGGEIVSGPNVIPAKYASPNTSDIKVTVASTQNQLKPILLR